MKRGSDNDIPPGEAKVRIFFAEVEGDNDSIKEALRSMAQAMNRPVIAQAPLRQIGQANGSSGATAAVVDGAIDAEL